LAENIGEYRFANGKSLTKRFSANSFRVIRLVGGGIGQPFFVEAKLEGAKIYRY